MSRTTRSAVATSAPILLALTLTCASPERTGDATAAPASAGSEVSNVLELYRDQGCPVCHGDRAEGVEDAGPALDDLAGYWNVERLSSYLEDPDAFRVANPDFDERRDASFRLDMPAYDGLTEEQREDLARWLLTR
jgi:mono/diheme cytochrome c family protein